jgi:dTDP-4-dehydrorhamnose reductase
VTSGRRKSPRILLTGATGQVGWELARSLAPLGEVHTPSRGELDLAEGVSLAERVAALAPDVIVNPAAYTDVDGAEREQEVAHAVNAEAPRVLAGYAAESGALLVHFSTDYVFDGRGGSPYPEYASPAPLNVYGASKLEGERAIAASGARHLVFRTGWVFGLRGRNFLRTIRNLAREREELRVVDDQFGAPTWCRLLAEAASQVLAQSLRAGPEDPRQGVYHLTAGGVTSWHGFATAILRNPPPGGHRCLSVLPIPSAAYPTTARRPAYSVLDGTRVQRDFGVRLPEWQHHLALSLEDV